ncbi:hypothetical protein [Rhizobium sp. FKL33]|uniref:hypothetical protein n=1 Tax=Rhizobium sp. FKL33 TaxID=2562307 RepID=UPI001485594D|nr:hypothetical protein [Rhizobium sp. FKL33]
MGYALFNVVFLIGPLLASAFEVVSPSATALPEIARNLPYDFKEATDEFERRLKEKFPVSMSAAEVRSRLAKQGFKVDAATNTAEFETSGHLCILRWRLIWEEQGGIVTALHAAYGGICP